MKNYDDDLLLNYGNKFKNGSCNFKLYAPNAKKVYLYGNFNQFDKQQIEMVKDESGNFEVDVDCKIGDYYKYNVLGCDNVWREKSDPYALATEASDMTFSKIIERPEPSKVALDVDLPINIYEVNLSGFKRKHDEGYRNYKFDELKNLVDHASWLGHTYIELMPITEHPFLGSWGYQPTGLFATSFRYGDPHQLVELIEYAHSKGIGIILDFVVGHFCKDSFALENFDGSKLYEAKFNELWGVYNFNFESEYVRNFLKSAMDYWLSLGIDGLRIDAVSYILYHDGKEESFNPSGHKMLKELCREVHSNYPNSLLFAEDSSTYQWITGNDGIGFDYKWNMGWMNDVLSYFELDPIYRADNFRKLTFGFEYMENENYILPISHDEVVHLKKPLVLKFPGSYEQKLSQMRQFYMFMFLHPGSKLNFMGYELCETREFCETRELAWSNLDNEINSKMINFFRIINEYYKHNNCLSNGNFKYLCDNHADNVLSFAREFEGNIVQGIMNTSGIYYSNYKIPTMICNEATVVINSEDPLFGGNVITKDKHSIVEGSVFVDLPAHSMLYVQGRIKDGSIL